MTNDLAIAYNGYIDCLNAQDWSRLEEFVGDDVQYNGTTVGLAGYRAMLERDFREIPDLRFNIALLVCEATTVGARLAFDCTPVGRYFDLDINGRRVAFAENVFYEFQDGKIGKVWSVIDRAAIEAQLT
jgi:predicted ester cyclase